MALAYTAPIWEDGSGTGISASQLQAICNCIEGLVQGSDKAVHAVTIDGSVITLTYADGTQENFNAVNLKGIANVTEVVSDLDHDFTMTFTDGTVFTFTIKDGRDGSSSGDMLEADYDPDGDVKTAGGIPDYVAGEISGKADKTELDGWTTATQVSSGTFSFSGLDDTQGWSYNPEFWVDDNSTELNPTAQLTAVSGAGTSSMTVTYSTNADNGADVRLRIEK